ELRVTQSAQGASALVRGENLGTEHRLMKPFPHDSVGIRAPEFDDGGVAAVVPRVNLLQVEGDNELVLQRLLTDEPYGKDRQVEPCRDALEPDERKAAVH